MPNQAIDARIRNKLSLIDEKIQNFRYELSVEKDIATKFKLEKYISEAERDRQLLENQLSLQKTERPEECGDARGGDHAQNLTTYQNIEDKIFKNEIDTKITKSKSDIFKLMSVVEFIVDILKLKKHDSKSGAVNNEDLELILKEINGIEMTIFSPDVTEDDLIKALHEFNTIRSDIEILVAKLNAMFAGFADEAIGAIELFDNLVSKIGHKEFRKEAEVHINVINMLWRQLPFKDEKKINFSVFDDDAFKIMSVLNQIEARKVEVTRLIQKDQRKRSKTIAFVIGYVFLFILAFILSIIFSDAKQSFIGQAPLNEFKLPVIGIPWPVIVWSLVGSFAAIIHQFNKNPIYDFGNLIKWLLTRPVQGIVLGSAFYLVLVSGLFLLTGETPDANGPGITDEVILVLSFLVGFSDRFADQVFETLVQKYSQAYVEKGEGEE